MLFSVIESARFSSSQSGVEHDETAIADILCEYGNVLEGQVGGLAERLERAEEAYLDALERIPQHAPALRSYALLLDRSGRYALPTTLLSPPTVSFKQRKNSPMRQRCELLPAAKTPMRVKDEQA